MLSRTPLSEMVDEVDNRHTCHSDVLIQVAYPHFFGPVGSEHTTPVCCLVEHLPGFHGYNIGLLARSPGLFS